MLLKEFWVEEWVGLVNREWEYKVRCMEKLVWEFKEGGIIVFGIEIFFRGSDFGVEFLRINRKLLGRCSKGYVSFIFIW